MSNAATTNDMTAQSEIAADVSATIRDLPGWIGNHSGQILIGTLIGVGIVAILFGLRSLGVRMMSGDRHDTSLKAIIGRAIAKTHWWFIVCVAIQAVAGYAATPPTLLSFLRGLFVIAVILQIAIWAREVVIGLIERRAGQLDDHSGLQSAMGIIRLLISFGLFAVATILILSNLGVNVTALVAGLGIGGIAIGLAAQGIFSDLFAALSILFDRPFRRGDTVRWDTTSGTIEAIGLKSTRVRALTGEQIVISNTNLLNKELQNLTRVERRRVALTLSVIYQTAPATLERIPALVQAIVERHPHCRFFRCVLLNFGASSLDFDFQFDVIENVAIELPAQRHAIMIDILQCFEREGIEFAYPTQTTFTAAPDGRLVMPYGDAHREDIGSERES